MATPNYTPSDVNRFWSKVAITANDDLCWEWQAGKHKQGYGQITIKRRLLFAHRVSWELTNYNIPEGKEILHSCDNPSCVNPKHLILGTHLDNMRDMVAKGRSPHGIKNFHCKLSINQVEYIRDRYAEGGITTRQLGQQMGVSHVQIVKIVNNQSRLKS